jgi:O-antigen/teichoic acid export membrane protein
VVNRNVVLTFLSAMGASALSLLTVPLYLHLIGPARYGVVAFVWLIVGYFGLFIVGLDKAITNLLAQHRDDPPAARSLFHTAALLNLATSGAGGVIMYFVGYQLLARTLGTEGALRGEILGAMPWIAASVPLATTTAMLTGALEAYGRFPALASTQFSATVLFQTVPVLVAWLIGPQLTWVIPAAILARTGATLWMLVLLWPIMSLHADFVPQRRWVAALLRYGCSIGVSGIVSPILTSLDRLLIGGALGASAVSYYVVPSNLINVVQMVPASLLRVLFPQLSVLSAAGASAVSADAVLSLSTVLTPLITCGILLAHPFMTLWLGAAFAGHMRGIAEILLDGAWINCLAWVPVTLLQAQRRPGLVARLHVIELAPFVALVWLGVHFGGIYGAALACALRMWADALLLFKVSGLARQMARALAWPASMVSAALLASLAMPETSPAYLAVAPIVGAASIAWSASHVPAHQKQRVLALLHGR